MKKLVYLWLVIFVLAYATAVIAYSSPDMITDITFNNALPLRPGNTLTVTLRGEPGSIATFDVGNIAAGIPMTEISSGIYVGTYVIPAGIAFNGVTITGHLVNAGQNETKIAAYTLTVLPPMVMAPARSVVAWQSLHNGSYVVTDPPYIYMKHAPSDLYTQQHTSMFVDGRDVTPFAVIGTDYVAYSPPGFFELGTHHVEILGTNEIGAQYNLLMGFRLEAAGLTFPSANVTIFDNVPYPAKSGDTVVVTLMGRPLGNASFDLGTYRTGIPMTEISPGVYVGTVHVDDASAFNNSLLTGHLSIPTGETYVASAPTLEPPAFSASMR